MIFSNFLFSHVIFTIKFARISHKGLEEDRYIKTTMQKKLSCQCHKGCKSEIKKSHPTQIFGVNIILWYADRIPHLSTVFFA